MLAFCLAQLPDRSHPLFELGSPSAQGTTVEASQVLQEALAGLDEEEALSEELRAEAEQLAERLENATPQEEQVLEEDLQRFEEARGKPQREAIAAPRRTAHSSPETQPIGLSQRFAVDPQVGDSVAGSRSQA